jgi:hypothetical protein
VIQDEPAAGTLVNIFRITGAIIGNANYCGVPIIGVSGTAPAANNTLMSIVWSRTGDRGAQGVQGASGGGASSAVADAINATRYPLFVDVASGAISSLNTSATQLTFNPSTGTLSATTFNSLSDILRKENIETIKKAVEIVDQLRGVKFNWRDTGLPSIGVIAQELEKVLPELVETNQNNKTVNYSGIIAILIEAVKNLSSRVNDLERKSRGE